MSFKSSDTLRAFKIDAMCKNHIYRWGCKCCGPDDNAHRRAVHKTERQLIKRDVKKMLDRLEDLE